MSARDQDFEPYYRDQPPSGDACEDDLDHAVVERVYGVAPPSPQRLLRRAHQFSGCAKHDD